MTTLYEGRRITVRHMIGQSIAAVDPRTLVRNLIKLSEAPPKVSAVPVGATVCQAHYGMPPISLGGNIVYPESVNRLIVIGAGKASADMAGGLLSGLTACGESGDLLLSKLSGVVNVPDGMQRDFEHVEVIGVRPAGQNAVTDRVLAATQRQLDLISGWTWRDLWSGNIKQRVARMGLMRAFGSLGRSDIIIDLISGGGSATRELLCPGLTLSDLEEVRKTLSEGGASIQELNAVRKCCSLVKGGMMNLQTNAGLILPWILSDVVGDPLDFIASGPWAASTSTPSEAAQILIKYGVTSGKVFRHVCSLAEKAWNPILPGSCVKQQVIGNNAIALEKLHTQLATIGLNVQSLGSNNEGDAKSVGQALAATELASSSAQIFGGETKVVIKKDRPTGSKGGRNQTIVLAALAAAWESGLGSRLIFSIGTDGEDGPTDAAGAMIDQGILDKAKGQGITLEDVRKALDDGDEYHLLDRIGALIKTGLTGTNVCDIWGVVKYRQ